MKRPVIGLFLLSLTACSPQGLMTAYHWKAFVKAPDSAHFDTLYADIKACKAAGCAQSEQITEEMIDSLADLVRAKNHTAMRLALASQTVLKGRAGTPYLAASYGPIIYADSKAFLQTAVSENNTDIANVLTTPQGQIVNYDGEYDELGIRRARLSQIDDRPLAVLRDRFVAAIDARRKAIEPSRLIPLRPMPVP